MLTVRNLSAVAYCTLQLPIETKYPVEVCTRLQIIAREGNLQFYF
jgi:hypothetical protein